MIQLKHVGFVLALGFMLVLPGVAAAAPSASDGSFAVANMAPPEPEPPTVPAESTPPAAAPDQPPAADVPPAPDSPVAPPETPPIPDAPIEVPQAPDRPLAAETPAPSGGIGMGAIVAIIIGLAVAGFGGYWYMNKK